MEQGNVHSVLFEKSDMYNYNTPEDLQFYTTNYGDPNTYTAQVNTGYFGQPTTQAYMHHNEFHTSGNFWSAFGTGGFADEPPLLEVLNPLKTIDKHLMDDTDLAGPLIYCLIFGVSLLLTGKAHFGYIYGVALLGWLSIYLILNLMSDLGIDVYRTASFLDSINYSCEDSFEDLVDSSGSGNAIANNANNINEVSPLNNSSSSNSNMERN
ncbi:6319_t:CDS:2 [Entrophospora sp. SA101]|nr:6319_t:CDS:2 [Entrophospora sp. SA101]